MGAEHSSLMAHAPADEAATHLATSPATAGLSHEPHCPHHQQHHHHRLRPGGPFKSKSLFGKHHVLHHAVHHNNVSSLRDLLDYLHTWTTSQQPGVDSTDAVDAAQALVNDFDSHQMTPLMIACQHGASEAAHLLLSHGADPLLADRAGNNSLHIAAKGGHVACLQEILSWEEQHEDPDARLSNTRNGYGYTPLHYAVWQRCREGAELLLSAGASLTARNTMSGWDIVAAGAGSTPLHIAAHRGSTTMAKTLLSAYLCRGDRARRIPDPRLLANSEGRVPYEVAQQRGRTTVLPVLNPTTEWQEIFGEGAEVAHLFSPATLAEMAAAQLRWKLLGELEQVESSAGAAHPPTPRRTHALAIPLRRHPSGRLPSASRNEDPCCEGTTPPATPEAHATHLRHGPFSRHHHTPCCSTSPLGSPMSDCALHHHHHHHHHCSDTEDSSHRSGTSHSSGASCSGCCATSSMAGPFLYAGEASTSSSSSGSSSTLLAAAPERGELLESDDEGDEEEMCGICLESGEHLVHLAPCNHFTCVACMKQLLNTLKMGVPPSCPFCRGYIAALK